MSRPRGEPLRLVLVFCLLLGLEAAAHVSWIEGLMFWRFDASMLVAGWQDFSAEQLEGNA